MSTLFPVAVVFIALFIFQPAAKACSCGQRPSVEKSLEIADAVFFGRVYSFSLHPDSHRTALIEVKKSFKGGFEERQMVAVNTAIEGSLCGFDFVAGQYYIVYASQNRRVYHTDICTRTTRVPGQGYRIRGHDELAELVELSRKADKKDEDSEDDEKEEYTRSVE